MIVNELNPLPTNKVLFKLSSYKTVPKEAGCYILTTFDDAILYIGLSDNLFNRFRQHLDNSAKTNPTNDGKAIWFHYLLYDKMNLNKLERTWLNQFHVVHGQNPILNKIDSPIN